MSQHITKYDITGILASRELLEDLAKTTSLYREYSPDQILYRSEEDIDRMNTYENVLPILEEISKHNFEDLREEFKLAGIDCESEESIKLFNLISIYCEIHNANKLYIMSRENLDSNNNYFIECPESLDVLDENHDDNDRWYDWCNKAEKYRSKYIAIYEKEMKNTN
jgi:hypothetical protein